MCFICDLFFCVSSYYIGSKTIYLISSIQNLYQRSLINTEWYLRGDHTNSFAHVSASHAPSAAATKKPYLNNRKTSVRIFLLDIPKTRVRIKTDHLRPKEYHSMLAIFFKASLHILFLSYLTLNVVNSYMNNRYLECSWVVGVPPPLDGRFSFFYNIWGDGLDVP